METPGTRLYCRISYETSTLTEDEWHPSIICLCGLRQPNSY